MIMKLLIRPKAWEELEKKVMSVLSQSPEVYQVGGKTENPRYDRDLQRQNGSSKDIA